MVPRNTHVCITLHVWICFALPFDFPREEIVFVATIRLKIQNKFGCYAPVSLSPLSRYNHKEDYNVVPRAWINLHAHTPRASPVSCTTVATTREHNPTMSSISKPHDKCAKVIESGRHVPSVYVFDVYVHMYTYVRPTTRDRKHWTSRMKRRCFFW